MTEHRDRISLPDLSELRADVAELLPLIGRAGREPPRTLAILARQPDVLAPFLGWAAALALSGTLSARDHELLALRAAWNCRSEFEWAEHVGYAHTAGLTEIEVGSVARDIAAGAWTDAEAALLFAADELHRDQDISATVWARLADAFDEAQLVEILFVVGQYTMLSMVANAAGIGTPPGLPTLPPSS